MLRETGLKPPSLVFYSTFNYANIFFAFFVRRLGHFHGAAAIDNKITGFLFYRQSRLHNLNVRATREWLKICITE